MDYIPHSAGDVKRLMATAGIETLDALFDTIPASLILDDNRAVKTLASGALPWEGTDELGLARHLHGIAGRNRVYRQSFTGAGCYHHFIPAVVDHLASRGEFWTAYTPYQAEMSQGYLQAIFEYQSMMAALTGMEYSNASLHDGATALADAVVMAQAVTRKRDTVLIAGVPNPVYKNVLDTILEARGMRFEQVNTPGIGTRVHDKVMAVAIFSPDFLGNVLDVASIVAEVKARDPSIVIIQCITEAMSLGLLSPPGSSGVDITTGEAQSLGIPPQFGGPGLGFITTSDAKLLHKLPGRIVGVTREERGDRLGFTLTLQAREQHIRRERALSNICSNEALNMLRAAIYMAAVGGSGLHEIATINATKATWLKRAVVAIDGFELVSTSPTFNEFAVKTTIEVVERVKQACEREGILGPLDLAAFDPAWAGSMLFCVTELNDAATMDTLVDACKEASR